MISDHKVKWSREQCFDKSCWKCLKAAKDHFTSAKLLYTQTWGIYFTKPWIGTWILMFLLWQSSTLYRNICLPLTYSPRLPVIFFPSPPSVPPSLLSQRSQEREVQARRQMLEEERRRREEAERRLLDETAHRQRLVEEEVKMREKHFSQVSGAAGGDD